MLLAIALAVTQHQVTPQPHVTIVKQVSGQDEKWVAKDDRGKVLWTREARPCYVGPIKVRNRPWVILPTAPLNIECLTLNGKTIWSVEPDESGEPKNLLTTDSQVIYGLGIGTPAPGRYKEVSRNVTNGKFRWKRPRASVGRPIASLTGGRFITRSDFGEKPFFVSIRNDRWAVERRWKVPRPDLENLYGTNAAYANWDVVKVGDAWILRTTTRSEGRKYRSCVILSSKKRWAKFYWHLAPVP